MKRLKFSLCSQCFAGRIKATMCLAVLPEDSSPWDGNGWRRNPPTHNLPPPSHCLAVPSRAGGGGGSVQGGWLIAWRRPPEEDRTEPPDLGSHAELDLRVPSHLCKGRKEHCHLSPSCSRRRGVGIQLPRHHSIQPRLTTSGANWPRLDSCFYRLFAPWYWTSALTSLGFSDPSTQTNGVKPTHS